MSFEQNILSLLSSSNYQRLAIYRPPFDPFGVVIRNLHEASYSNVLKWLLGDPANEEFKRKFLKRVFCQGNEIDRKALDEKPDVEREFWYDTTGRIDVFFQTSQISMAIEVKVRVEAKESGDDQIERYQDFIGSCSNPKKRVVYLTKDGDPPTTDCSNSEVRVESVSWREIAVMISECSGHGEEHDFRVKFCNHIKRNILMERKEREIVIKLLREGNNYETIRKIKENFPKLTDTEYKKISRK